MPHWMQMQAIGCCSGSGLMPGAGGRLASAGLSLAIITVAVLVAFSVIELVTAAAGEGGEIMPKLSALGSRLSALGSRDRVETAEEHPAFQAWRQWGKGEAMEPRFLMIGTPNASCQRRV